jgi:hypothetical protein
MTEAPATAASLVDELEEAAKGNPDNQGPWAPCQVGVATIQTGQGDMVGSLEIEPLKTGNRLKGGRDVAGS